MLNGYAVAHWAAGLGLAACSRSPEASGYLRTLRERRVS